MNKTEEQMNIEYNKKILMAKKKKGRYKLINFFSPLIGIFIGLFMLSLSLTETYTIRELFIIVGFIFFTFGLFDLLFQIYMYKSQIIEKKMDEGLKLSYHDKKERLLFEKQRMKKISYLLIPSGIIIIIFGVIGLLFNMISLPKLLFFIMAGELLILLPITVSIGINQNLKILQAGN